MKDFLFRAKRKDNGEYIEGLPFYGLSAELKVNVSIIPFAEVPTGEDAGKKFSDTWEMQEVEEDTLSLFTGMTDKHGKKIFEGDILDYGGTKNEVVFERKNGSAYFGVKMSEVETWEFGHYVEANKLEVIGNIHDNPELLEVE